MIEYEITTPAGDKATAVSFRAARTAAVTMLTDAGAGAREYATVIQTISGRFSAEIRIFPDGLAQHNQGALRNIKFGREAA